MATIKAEMYITFQFQLVVLEIALILKFGKIQTIVGCCKTMKDPKSRATLKYILRIKALSSKVLKVLNNRGLCKIQ